MSTEQLIETEEERNFARLSLRVTNATIEAESKREEYFRYRHAHSIPTADVVARLSELRGAVEKAEGELQKLLPEYSAAKSRLNGWS